MKDSSAANIGITAVTVSRSKVSWGLDIPLYCHTDSTIVPPRSTQEKDRTRIQMLSKLKNAANDAALQEYPRTSHLLQIESYYLEQERAINRLVSDYIGFRKCVMGGATWCWHKTKIVKSARWYDTWSCPELSGITFSNPLKKPRGIRRVSSIGSIVIFPREVWDKGTRYDVPEPFPQAGCYYNHLCKQSGLTVWANLYASFWRDRSTNPDIPEYPWEKRIRCSIGYWLNNKIRRRQGSQPLRN